MVNIVGLYQLANSNKTMVGYNMARRIDAAVNLYCYYIIANTGR
jgi:hypothetical protein